MQPVSYHPIIDDNIYTEEQLYDMDRFTSVSEIYLADTKTFLAETVNSYDYKLVGYRTFLNDENTECELELLVCHSALNPYAVESSIPDMLQLI